VAEFRMVQTVNYGQIWINFDLVRSVQSTSNPPNGNLLIYVDGTTPAVVGPQATLVNPPTHGRAV